MIKIISSSFKDPSGFVFVRDSTVLRQVNNCFKNDFDFFLKSGLYSELTKSQLLIEHKEVSLDLRYSNDAYKVLQPEMIDFISYPYEWCFSQLKDAALLTLKLMNLALEKNMILKDASAFNVQFVQGKPIFIDTLSFSRYKEGEPWIAYGQFCEHFLGPLALMSFTDMNLNKLLMIYINGVPLELVDKLLPIKAKLKPGILIHIMMHARAKSYYSDKFVQNKKYKGKVSKHSLLGIIKNLEKTIKRLNLKSYKTEWSHYYNKDCNYTKTAFEHKKKFVKRCVDIIKPKIVWDLGANDGEFSRITAKYGLTLSFDNDSICVEKNYLRIKKNNEKNILPLIIDITNPSPDLGWNLKERNSLIRRNKTDLVLALALIHHLVFSHNISLDKIASFLARMCRYTIFEFIPKEDSQIKKLLTNRKDIFDNYKLENFEHSFMKYFEIIEKERVKDSTRILYLFKKRTL